MCGTYYPDETLPEKRFVLTVGSDDVPVFATTEHKMFFPQIQITPFLADDEYYVDLEIEKAPGVEPYTNPDLDYVTSEKNIHLKDARFHLDILGQNASQVRAIKTALVTRLRKFRNTIVGEFIDSENWTLVDGIYTSTEYTSSFLDILRVFDQETELTKVDTLAEVSLTEGSWYIGTTGFYINPLTSPENFTFIEKIYGETFSDRLTMKEKGIKNISISSSVQGYDKSPEISRWMMIINLKYTEIEEKDIGRSFKEAGINAQTD